MKVQPKKEENKKQPNLEENRKQDGRGTNDFPQRPTPQNKGGHFNQNGYHSNHHAINHQI